MESWVVYGMIAAILIAGRDFFTKGFTKKYTVTEHLLHYYILTTFFVLLFALYKKYIVKEPIRLVDNDDIWKYIMIAVFSAIIITPCQLLSIKNCNEPSRATSVINLSSLFLFFVSLYFVKSMKFSFRILCGIILTVVGVYLVIK
jgi:drug/metabolite transporter (DMT)-like permease